PRWPPRAMPVRPFDPSLAALPSAPPGPGKRSRHPTTAGGAAKPQPGLPSGLPDWRGTRDIWYPSPGFSTAFPVPAPCPRTLLAPVRPASLFGPLEPPSRLAAGPGKGLGPASMGLATEARRWLAALPPEVGERVGSIAAWAPRDMLYGSRFRRVRATLAATERRPASDLRAWQDARVAELVALAYERVPHYRIAMQARGVRPEHVKGVTDLPLLPLLTKDDVRRDPDALLARGVPVTRRERVSTGGTSGDPLTLWIDRGRS